EDNLRSGKSIGVKIFATDAAVKALDWARAGVYPGGYGGDLSLERLDRFFEKEEHGYRLRNPIRDMVVFAPQNVLRDPPFSHVDICTCRNLLIYLEPDVQERVLALLHFALKHGGTLFLGSAETPGSLKGVFEAVSLKHRIYRRIGPHGHRHPELPAIAARMLAAAPRSAVRTVPAEGVTKDSANDALLQEELRIARRELQSTVEAFESSNEELKASNEEVISINEELQSTNEELETSKEELQSMNEELITVNGQLQSKIAELEAANNDLSNLWSSTSIGVVFLDLQLQVRRFTPAMNELIALRPSDVG